MRRLTFTDDAIDNGYDCSLWGSIRRYYGRYVFETTPVTDLARFMFAKTWFFAAER